MVASRKIRPHLSDPVPMPGSVGSSPDSAVRVLVVDDDARNLLTISEVLEGVGQIDCVQSGEEALRQLLRHEYAVILLDVLMPGLDGYQTAELIRQREASRTIPIIFLTAINKEDAHMLRGYGAGAVDYLFKPFDPVMLRSKVTVFVDLFEKTQAVRQKAEAEQRLLEDNLLANTQKLEALDRLRLAEERQEAILRSLPICLYSRSIEPPHPARFVSGAIERLTGFPPEEFSRDPAFGVRRVHPDDRPHVATALREGVRAGSYATEFRWQCADGNYRHFLDQGVVLRDEQGEPREIAGTFLDITERRLLEDQLIHAQKLDAIGKLTGGVAHDFNNLLASIMSGLALLQRRVEMDEAARQIFDMTQHAARQGSELIARMLTFSRRQRLSPVNVELSRLAESLDLLLVPVLGGRVALEWQIQQEQWQAFVDPGQLELAVMNLIINARDAMPDGGTITIRSSNCVLEQPLAELPAGQYAVLRVEDSGSGIPPENLTKVLDPFFTTKEAGRGTGLGLSTVYGFVRQSGGTLKIESEVGRGTAVELWLPRAELEQKQSRAKTSTTRSNFSLKKRPSILLVDDSDDLRTLTEQRLREDGFEVTCAAGGAEAIGLLKKQPQRCDLIITDFAMPLVSGLEVVKTARGMRPDWPAVVITGYADTEALADRPKDVPIVNKPFDWEVLMDAVERQWAGGSGRIKSARRR